MTTPAAVRGRRPEADLRALRERIEGLMLASLRAPAIHRALSGPESPNPLVLSVRQVRAHMRAVERGWAERASSEELEADRARALALAEDAIRTALARSTINANSNVGVGYFNAALKAQERVARLRGLDAPARSELSGPDGAPLRFELTDHPAEHLEPAEEARRYRVMADDLEAEAGPTEPPAAER